MRFWNYILNEKPWKVLLFIFLSILILRLPTLFVEYYSGDVLSSFIIAKKQLSGLPFTHNKLPVYHALLNFSLLFFGNSVISFHFLGIIIVMLTSFFIYLTGKTIFSNPIGIIASLLYGVYISAFNPEFMAINGEIVYNLFLSAGFYFFALFEFQKKIWAIPLILISFILSFLTKVQGLFGFVAILLFYIVVRPYFVIKNKENKKKYTLVLISSILFLILVFIIDWNYTHIVLKGKLKAKINGFYIYATVRSFNIPILIGRLLFRGGLMSIYHNLLWVFGIVKIVSFFRSKEKNLKDAFLITIALFLFFSIFLAGNRLYFHYFMPIYIPLSLIAASYMHRKFKRRRFKKRSFKLLLFPILFVFLWNAKDAYISQINPNWFYNEGKTLYAARLILMGHHDDYLLPNKNYVKALKLIKKYTPKETYLYLWSMGAEFLFFSKCNSVQKKLTGAENGALNALKKKDSDFEYFKNYQFNLIKNIKNSKWDYFIDTTSTPIKSKLTPFGGLKAFPIIYNFLNENYQYMGKFGSINIWKFKKVETYD